jgi:hypothetical protein
VHCKGGKGRTGTMICALLMMMMHMSSAEAMEFFASKRSINLSVSRETVSSPSQKMMLQVFQESLSMPYIPNKVRVLRSIIISSSVLGIDCLKPVVAIYQQHSLVHCSLHESGKRLDVGVASPYRSQRILQTVTICQ